MTETKSKGPIFDPGLCRCCGSIKKCRLLNIEYEYSGQKEIYSDMFFDCFGLLLSQLDGDPKERLICATCVSRLREAHCFRQQVLQCEEFLLQSKLGPDDVPLIELKPGIKVEVSIKQENTDADDNCNEDDNHIDDVGDCGDNDDMDDIPLSETFHKEISKKTARKRKAPKGNDSGTDKLKMLSEIKKTKAKLKKLNSDVSDVPSEPVIIPQIPTRPETLLRIDAMAAKAKALRNTATIVKYSYACPFYTPYSSDYFCVYCRERFADPEKFREHNLSHDPAKYQDFALKKKYPQIDIYRIDCRLCSEKINDLNTFKIHIKRVHGKMFFLNVPDGFLKFKLTAKNLSCTECNASFDFFMSLKKHMAEHFGTCICDVCGAHFFEETMLIVHQKTHQKNLESYTCEQCGKTFKSKYSRHLHIAKIHTKESIYQCTKCDQSFFTKTLRIKHMKDAHGEIRKFTCGQCDRFYDNRRSLTEHYRKCHTKYFKHQCNICDKRFYMPCQLKEHMTIHTGERNFRCDQCGKTYPRLRALKLHMQSHNDKKHSCSVCNASFTQKGSLKNHMQKQHQSINLNEQFHLYE